jgi:hypothetical protein
MGQAIRVTLQHTTGHHGAFTFDVVTDSGDLIVGAHRYFGFSIGLDKNLWPVILESESNISKRSEINFGAGLNGQPDGIWWTNIRSQPIRRGNRVLVWDHNLAQNEYIVKNIVSLAEL